MSYCYTPNVSVHMLNDRANVKVLEFIDFILPLNFGYHTNKAPYNKSLRQARILWLWHLWSQFCRYRENNPHAKLHHDRSMKAY